MSNTEAARAEAFASQADRSRAQAADFVRQAIETAKAIRDTKYLIDQALNSIAIQHRWSGTVLEILSPNGEWVAGPDLRGRQGRSVTSVAIDEDYHLIFNFDDDTSEDAGYARGGTGPAGKIINVAIETLAPGLDAEIENVGTEEEAELVLRVPRGAPGLGDVNGPASSTDNNVALFNGAAGDTLKDGGSFASLMASTGHAATAKTTPVDADEISLYDSAASWVLKRLTWSNIKTTLKAYFDTLYATATQGGKADTALQPAAIGVSVQAYDATTAKTGVDQSWSGAQRGNMASVTSATTITLAAANGNDFGILTLAHNATLANFSDIGSFVNQKGSVVCQQDGTGGRTLAFGSFWFPIGSTTAPAIPAGPNAKFRIDYHIASSTRIDFSVSSVGI